MHDLLGSRCDPYVNRILTGADFDFHGHSNLTRAVLPYGLTELAEQDLLCALSTCPAGDLSVPNWGPDSGDPVDVCRPLGVEVFRPAAELVESWTTSPSASYGGLHGMTMPTWSTD